MKSQNKLAVSLRRFPFVMSHSLFLQTYENDSLQLAAREKRECGDREEAKERGAREPLRRTSVRAVRMAMKGSYPAS
jgi:hypothetical protein